VRSVVPPTTGRIICFFYANNIKVSVSAITAHCEQQEYPSYYQRWYPCHWACAVGILRADFYKPTA
jgi:hypothetical protein